MNGLHLLGAVVAVYLTLAAVGVRNTIKGGK